EKRQRARNASVSRLASRHKRRIIDRKVRGLACSLDEVGRRERPQRQAAATRQDRRQHPSRRVADQKKRRPARRLLKYLEQGVGGIRIEFVDGIDDADPPALLCSGRTKKRDRFAALLD